MNKKPLYLVSALPLGLNKSVIKDSDSEIVVKIKKFMQQNDIFDIKIRMLEVEELKLIQGFPANFELTGTKTNQLKFIGNSVVPLMAQRLIESNYESLCSYLLKNAA